MFFKCICLHSFSPLLCLLSQVILNYLLFDYDLQKAVKEPRVQVMEDETNVEKFFDMVGFLHFYTPRQIYNVRKVIIILIFSLCCVVYECRRSLLA